MSGQGGDFQAIPMSSASLQRAMSGSHAGPLPPLIAPYGPATHGTGAKMLPGPFTNVLVREAVLGRPEASHCGLQTDLCGYTWPLDQPFPMPTHVYVPASSLQYAANGLVAVPHGVALGASHAGGLAACPAGDGALPSRDCLDAPAGADMVARGVPIPPPSPPSSPPPELVDMLLFDFDRLDESRGTEGLEESSDLADLESVLAMEYGQSDGDFFSLFGRDQANGWPMMTTHLHLHQAAEASPGCASAEAPVSPMLGAKRAAADALPEVAPEPKRLYAIEPVGDSGRLADSPSSANMPGSVAMSCKQAVNLVKHEAHHGAFAADM